LIYNSLSSSPLKMGWGKDYAKNQ